MADEREKPEFLEKLMKDGPIKTVDGIGPEDIAWTGRQGELDPD